MTKLAIITCQTLPEPDRDEELLREALRRANIDATWVAWDDPKASWSTYDAGLFRSCWNYAHHPEAFAHWLNALESQLPCFNAIETVRWNLHKSYLLRFADQEVATVPTVLTSKGDNKTLHDILETQGWDDAVIKPAISAGSFKTLRVQTAGTKAAQEHFKSLQKWRDVLVQPYLPSVEEYGERAIVVIDGSITHAVRKSPRFMNHDENVSGALEVSASERTLVEQVLTCLEKPPLYVRVDVAPGLDGKMALMEVELIEPSLFFLKHPPALQLFIEALKERLDGLAGLKRT